MLAIAGLSLANGGLLTTILTLGLAIGCGLAALVVPDGDDGSAPRRRKRKPRDGAGTDQAPAPATPRS